MSNSQDLEHVNSESSDAVVDTSAQKQSKKRVITAARKEQNKLAQRAYRKRQREQKKIQKRSVVNPGPRRLEPRQDDTEGLSVSDSSSSPKHDGESKNSGPIAEPLCFQPTETEALINSQLDLGDLPAIDLQVTLHDKSSSPSLSEGETTNVSPASNSTKVSNEIRTYPPGLVGMCLSIPGSLEDNPTAVFRACLANAICIGIDLAELMFCEMPCMSPFYQPAAQANQDPAALVAASSHDSLPISLKPTLAQILIPHHASIDLIPLPRLRERAILMCSAVPHLFSLWDMKLDVYTRNALTCQSRDAESGSAFQPWDKRSWQAAPWFLSKWKMVVDSDEVDTSLSLPGIPGLWI